MCAYLLRELPLSDGERFLTSPSRCTISACALLTWLPAPVIKKMNHVFGARLREELIETMIRISSVNSRQPSPPDKFTGASLTVPLKKSYQTGGVLRLD